MAAPMDCFDVDSAALKSTISDIFPSFTERYFTAKYQTDMKGKPNEDFRILQHSNKICVITLARGHPIVRDKLKVDKVDFQVTPTMNRMNNKVVGKSKKGAQGLRDDSPLCSVHCSDGQTFTVYSCLRGKLVEVNDTLTSHPELLMTKPDTEGYMAIVLLKLADCDAQLDKLISEESYTEILASRSTKKAEFVHEPENELTIPASRSGDSLPT